MIAERVKVARRSDEDFRLRIMRDLVQANVFSLVFSQQRFHLQIAKRSEDIIKIYISEKNFD